uniref:Uncharacterized protein n=1 Tax=Romanomermis culicivorax TaxID=13658 RepID=A0A915IQM0_ROMCU
MGSNRVPNTDIIPNRISVETGTPTPQIWGLRSPQPTEGFTELNIFSVIKYAVFLKIDYPPFMRVQETQVGYGALRSSIYCSHACFKM